MYPLGLGYIPYIDSGLEKWPNDGERLMVNRLTNERYTCTQARIRSVKKLAVQWLRAKAELRLVRLHCSEGQRE